MTTQLSPHDWEQLSAYMDGKLSIQETQKMGQRLDDSKELRLALKQLQNIRSILKSIPMHRARRNFLLTPEMVQPGKAFKLIPVFRFASMAASLALVVLFVLNFLPNLARMSIGAQAPMAEVASETSADRAVEEAAPQIIFWGTPTLPIDMMGKGGGALPPSKEEAPAQSMPMEEPAIENMAVPEATAQPELTLGAEDSSADAGLDNGPILGIPTGDEQEEVSQTKNEESRDQTGKSINYIYFLYIGLALVAVGSLIACFIIQKKR